MRQPRLRVRVRQRRRGRRSWTLCRWACIRSRCRGRLIPVHCVGCSHHPRARQHFDTRCCEHRVFVCTSAFSPPKDSTPPPLVGSRNRLGPARVRHVHLRDGPWLCGTACWNGRVAGGGIDPDLRGLLWSAPPPRRLVRRPAPQGRDPTSVSSTTIVGRPGRAPRRWSRRGALAGQSRRRARDRGRGQARP